ncbi:unnamed protein product, partial [Urochloa humidicola]
RWLAGWPRAASRVSFSTAPSSPHGRTHPATTTGHPKTKLFLSPLPTLCAKRIFLPSQTKPRAHAMEAAAATALSFAAAAGPVISARGGGGCTAAGHTARPRLRLRQGRWRGASAVAKMEGGLGKGVVPTTNYVVPLDKATGMTRPLVEILRDLNKRVPDKIIDPDTNTVHWYHANRMLSFYAPGWCGEVRDVIYSENGTVTVVYRVILRGTDGEAYRDATGTAKVHEGHREDAVAAAEEEAFIKACARFGFGLYLYHQDDTHHEDHFH